MSDKIELGENAIAYIRSNLIGWGGMWKSIGERDLESGSVFAYFPRSISDSASLNLEEGLFNQEERMRDDGDWSSKDKPNLFVKAYLARGSEQLALLQRPRLRPNRNYPTSSGEHFGFVKRTTSERPEFPTEIYQYFTGGDASIKDVAFFMSFSEFWSMTCALTSTNQQLTSGMEVDAGFVLDCAKNTQYLLMNACDGDITLVWSADRTLREKLETEAS